MNINKKTPDVRRSSVAPQPRCTLVHDFLARTLVSNA